MLSILLPVQLRGTLAKMLERQEHHMVASVLTGYLAGVGVDISRLVGMDQQTWCVLVSPAVPEYVMVNEPGAEG